MDARRPMPRQEARHPTTAQYARRTTAHPDPRHHPYHPVPMPTRPMAIRSNPHDAHRPRPESRCTCPFQPSRLRPTAGRRADEDEDVTTQRNGRSLRSYRILVEYHNEKMKLEIAKLEEAKIRKRLDELKVYCT
uniref:BZIP domain-containing protein n=1 Tax=Caenorhabditis tropicalis TaxID=1561998 RepID=A0A1I7TEA4_9PELO